MELVKPQDKGQAKSYKQYITKGSKRENMRIWEYRDILIY